MLNSRKSNLLPVNNFYIKYDFVVPNFLKLSKCTDISPGLNNQMELHSINLSDLASLMAEADARGGEGE